MSAEQANVVIAGAGLAGARCAEALRAAGCRGRIVMLGDEPHAPYERPALSKDVLTGARPAAALGLRAPDFWESRRIELRTGSPVENLDLEARQATIAGARLGFRHLVLATGLRARRLPAVPDGPGVHYLRTLDDAEALRRELAPGVRLVVVGAGFVGLEVASSAIGLGAHVTVVDPGPTPFARTLGPEVGERLGERARAAGTELLLLRSVAAVERGPDARPLAVELDDGSRRACDLIVVGAGAIPNTELTGGQVGLADDGGIATDASGCTDTPGIYACGDVASIRRTGEPGTLRLEHWATAATSARAVARAISGVPAVDDGPPFFWSDQFGWRLQAVGLPSGRSAVAALDPARDGWPDRAVRADSGRAVWAQPHEPGDDQGARVGFAADAPALHERVRRLPFEHHTLALVHECRAHVVADPARCRLRPFAVRRLQLGSAAGRQRGRHGRDDPRRQHAAVVLHAVARGFEPLERRQGQVDSRPDAHAERVSTNRRGRVVRPNQ